MPKIYFPVFLACFLLFPVEKLQAQAQEITLTKFETEAPHTDFRTKTQGVAFVFDIRFSQYVARFSQRLHDVYYRLVDVSGKTIFDSRLQQLRTDRKIRVRPDRPTTAATHMVDEDVKVFIPYYQIDHPTGTCEATLILSVENDQANYPDVLSREVRFEHVETQLASFAEQEFNFENFRIDHGTKGFAVDEKGLSIRFDVRTKFESNSFREKHYKIYWEMYDAAGKQLFDSREAKSIHHRSKMITAGELEDKLKKGMELFTPYSEIAMDGPGEAEIVLTAETDLKAKREIYRQTHALGIPSKYRFEEQEFTASDVRTKATERDGVSGIEIDFRCDFKYNSPRSDPDRGDYYFYAVLRKAGKDVLHPRYPNRDHNTTVDFVRFLPDEENASTRIVLFLPYHKLLLPPGRHTCDYTLHVSDKQVKARFPILVSGTMEIAQPAVHTYRVRVAQLSVVANDYDTEISVFGNRKPDLRWSVQVGRDVHYRSATGKNEMFAPQGQATVRLAEGDALSLVLVDVDKGLFNRNDLLGRWKLDYPVAEKKKIKIVDKQGMIKRMEVVFERLK